MSMKTRGGVGELRGSIQRSETSFDYENPSSPLLRWGHQRSQATTRQPYQPLRGSEMDYRMRYYNTLVGKMSTVDSINAIPEHLVPAELYHVHVDSGDSESPGDGKQSSIMTVFSIWNTMMGSSLLALPWGFSQAGLVGGLVVSISVGIISWYTCWLVLKYGDKYEDFFDLCEAYLGIVGRWGSWIASIAVLVGALISYDILMTNSLFNNVQAFREMAHHSSNLPDVPYWNKYIAAGIMAIVVFPLTNLKQFQLLVKINSFGIISVFYIIGFILGYCTIHEGLKFKTVPVFESKFYYLSGILAVSYFIHNAIMSIMKNQRNPENNFRDLGLGYLLVGASYVMVGSVGYLAYHNIEKFPQDFLDVFQATNPAALIARFALLFQLISVYPLLCTIVRIQFFGMVWKSQYPGWIHVLILNIVLVSIGTLFAMFYPYIGTVLRYVGSITGMLLVFVLPTVAYLVEMYKDEGYLPYWRTCAHVFLLLLGASMLVAQFV